MHPVRLQLSRRKGFNLQETSRATNGLDVVNVARPGFWGNQFVVTTQASPGHAFKGVAYGYIAVPTVEDAIACFREMLTLEGERAESMRKELPTLRGKNLACWCKPGSPCHADVLLELANRPLCEEISGTLVNSGDIGDE